MHYFALFKFGAFFLGFFFCRCPNIMPTVFFIIRGELIGIDNSCQCRTDVITYKKMTVIEKIQAFFERYIGL